MARENGREAKPSTMEVTAKGLKKAMVNSTSRVAISTRVTSSRTGKKATDKCSGLMVVFIRDSGKTEPKTAKGKFTLQVVTL